MPNAPLHTRFASWLSCRRGPARASRARRARPLLEGLEDRLTPTTQLHAGSLVPTFGSGGKLPTQFFDHASGEANGVVVQPDGKVVAVGGVGQFDSGLGGFALSRYNADGSLDKSFGPDHNGQVLTSVARLAAATAVTLEGGGKLLVAGYTRDPVGSIGHFALARYGKDGSLDTSFGTAGVVTTAFGAADEATSIALDRAGRIVLAGYTATLTGTSGFALARYTANGTLDRTFGTDGKVVTEFGHSGRSSINAVALDSQGRIVVAGFTQAGGTAGLDFALARYTATGTLDRTFGTGGEVATKVRGGDDDVANGLVIQPDGKIVAVGSAQNNDTQQTDFALARYTAAGALDATFGAGGKVTTSFPSASGASAVLLQPDGRLVVAGGIVGPFDAAGNFELARYNAAGSLDTTFGTGGHVVAGFANQSVSARGIARGKNGQLVVVGGTINVDTPGDFALARFNAGGSLDPFFGAGGQVITAFTAPVESSFHAIAVQSDGKLLVVGDAANLFHRLGVLRLNKDGSRDTTFGTGGQTFLSADTGWVQKVLVQPDGKILVVESDNATGGSGGSQVSLWRLNADGTLDTHLGNAGRVVAVLPGGRMSSVLIAGVVLQPDGKIVVGTGIGNFDLVRFNKNGSLDTGFGSAHTGWVTTAFSSRGGPSVYALATGLALEPDGKLLMAGSVLQVLAGGRPGNFHIPLVRYNADGTLDRSFGTGGVVLGPPRMVAATSGVVVQPDGKIVVGGTAGPDDDFFLARFNKDGSPDRSFGTGGQTLTDFGGTETAHGLALDPAGRIVLAGSTEDLTTGAGAFAVALYTADGRLDTHFGTDGKVTTSFSNLPGALDEAVGLALGPHGTVVVAGSLAAGGLGPGAIVLAEYAAGP